MTTVTITRRNVIDVFAGITRADVASFDIATAKALWADVGGATSPSANFLTQPNGSAKSRKSVLPEYMLYLAPHKLASGVNLCKWSTAGCRSTCLFTAGRGGSPTVYNGRMARTVLMLNHPTAFLALVFNDLRKANAKGAAWVRLNGTSDIPWERLFDGEWVAEFPNLQFADYTKATAAQRPQPTVAYKLTRSVWAGTHSTSDIAALLANGERVSMIVADPSAIVHPNAVVADKTDEWLLRADGVLGMLAPKGKLRYSPDNYYANSDALAALRNI